MPGLSTDYFTWNNAIAEVVFPEVEELTPVYLDLDDEPVGRLANLMHMDADAVLPSLWSLVASTLDMTGTRADVFARYDSALWAYGLDRERSLEAPPHLALLACFSLAAETMGRDATIASPANYYGRLSNGFGIADKEKLGDAYRQKAETYWDHLNSWLGRHEGRRGLPTAFSVEPRYVGLAVSQALIRRVDRERLITFFASRNLAPGAHVSGFALQELLDEWLTSPRCNASKALQRLWSKEANRDRLCEIVALELSHWDGRAADQGVLVGEDDLGQRVRLSAQKGGVFSPALTISALVYASQSGVAREASVDTDAGEQPVSLVPVFPGALQLGDFGQMDASSLVSGVTTVHDSLTGQTIRRRPRRVVLFRRDDNDRMVEVDQVMLGDECWLLVKDEVLPKTLRILQRTARSGWAESNPPGVPDGWHLITDVQVMSHPTPDLVSPSEVSDFAVLVPATTSQLSLSKGLGLPGSRRNQWHVFAAPEVVAVSDVPGGFTIEVVDESVEGDQGSCVVERWSDGGTGTLVVDLGSLDLEPGSYRIVMSAADGRVLTSRSVGLRDGDVVDQVQWERAEAVAHDATGLGAVLAESRDDADGALVQGAMVIDASPVRGDRRVVAVPVVPWWRCGGSGSGSREVVRVGVPDASSCIWTGAHRTHIDLVPVDGRGRASTRWTRGECTICGLVRRYPTAAGRAVKREVARVTVHDVRLVPPILSDGGSAWETVWDALSYAGGGSWSSFERLALSIERTPLAVERVARAFQSLGHMDYVVDSESLAPVRWEIAPTALVPVGDRWYVAGHWPGALFNMMSDVVSGLGGTVVSVGNEYGPPTWFVSGVERDRLEPALAAGGVAVEFSQGWEMLVDCLSPISEVVAALPRRRAVESSGRLTRWDVDHACWVEVRSIEAPGAYRRSKFRTEDFIRTEQDVVDGTVAMSTVYLSKHAAAFIQGRRPYLVWSPDNSALCVPKGADLPGLHARAAVMASGRLPVMLHEKRLLAYPEVPRLLAERLAYLLSN